MLSKFKSLFAPEQKRHSAQSLISLYQSGHAQWTPRNYHAMAREGFSSNAISYRCVRMIAEAASSVPLLLYQGKVELEQHPVLDILQRPNPAQTGRELIENIVCYLLLAGNSYVEISSLDERPRQLNALRPDRMRVVPGSDGWPDHFEYSVYGASAKVPAERVLHIRLFNPIDDYYGQSPLEAAQRSIDTHNAACAWNKSMLDNAARPSGALVFASADEQLTNEQFARLKDELEQSYQGAANAGRPMVLEGGLDWKEMGYSPKDMDFISAKNSAAREIGLAFGVPPMLLGIPGDNTYANYAEANRTFWRQTVIPLLGKVIDALETGVARPYGTDLRLGYDLDQVEALSHDRDALWKRVNDASFLSEDEKRQAVGYGK
ncbi:MAG: phage portal protein [Alphaproteobacteria bacterium]|nr:phage portal protein [Alphaproteobacteria bacterium]